VSEVRVLLRATPTVPQNFPFEKVLNISERVVIYTFKCQVLGESLLLLISEV
jgi:hypothetical protein